MGDLKQLTDKELEQLIYEYIHEIRDSRYFKKLLKERERRNLDE